MSLIKRQHYVPQFYLKYFTDNEDEKLYVLDKESGKIFHKNVLEICEQNYYYSFYEKDEYNFIVEKQLGKKESDFSCVLRKLIDNVESFYYTKTKPLNKLTHNEKKIILEFVLYQLIRVPKFIDVFYELVIPKFEQFNLEDGIVKTKK